MSTWQKKVQTPESRIAYLEASTSEPSKARRASTLGINELSSVVGIVWDHRRKSLAKMDRCSSRRMYNACSVVEVFVVVGCYYSICSCTSTVALPTTAFAWY